MLYGHTIANELIHTEVNSSGSEVDDSMDMDEDEEAITWKAEVYFTNANYQAKRTNFLLFINRRRLSSHHTPDCLTLCSRPLGGIIKDEEGDRSCIHQYSTERHVAVRLLEVSSPQYLTQTATLRMYQPGGRPEKRRRQRSSHEKRSAFSERGRDHRQNMLVDASYTREASYLPNF